MDKTIQVCDKINFSSDSLEKLAEINLGNIHMYFTTFLNYFINVSKGAADIMFSCKFFEYASCQLNIWSCGDLFIMQLILLC